MIAMESRTLPAPEPNPETKSYWDAAQEGKLLVRICTACGRAHHYPRALCPFCFSDRTEWKTASGNGTIYSFSVMQRAPVPYTIAYVTLDEGPTMMSNIVDCDFDTIRIGMKVKATFKPTESTARLPMFTPA
ncbi:MAG TPA: Zn-ribbon domain-containing OB-fold protein [Acetobacteraceae bacterium]|nr:Zn-ribbon domain-containing OB-fold protein [Acetobacteraceae bacterium]